MRDIRTTIEQGIKSFCGEVIRFRLPVLIGIVLVSVLFAYQIRLLEVDTSNEGFLHEDDYILQRYNQFRDQFGRDDLVVVAIASDDIFSIRFLQKLQNLHNRLWQDVPYVNDITSLVNVRNTRGEGDVLYVDDLLADFPQDQEDLQLLRKQVMTNPLYRNQLISADGKFTTVVIESQVYQNTGEVDLLGGFSEPTEPADSAPAEYLSDEQNSEFVRAIARLVSEYHSPGFRIYLAGTPVVTDTVKRLMMEDMKKFIRLALLIIAVCLYIMFRRLSGVFLPLLTVALSFVTILGLMATLDISFKLPTTILPSFLLAVGVGASVHVLSLTYQGLRHGHHRHQAIVAAFGHSGLAICITSLTTAAGLASFSLAEVAPIADLGLFSAIGVMISLVYTMTFLPAMLSFIPIERKKMRESTDQGTMDRLLDWLAGFSVRRYRPILGMAAAVVLISIVGIFQVRFSHDVLRWLPENLPVRQATETIDQELRGSVVMEVVLDTGRENGLYDREVLVQLDTLLTELEAEYAGQSVFIGKTLALTTILKEIHQALHNNSPDFYRIPENGRLIPQEFLLFENSGSDDLEDVVDSRFQKARVTIKVPWRDALLYVPFMDEVRQRFVDTFMDHDDVWEEEMQITVTGIMSLFGRIIHAAIYSAAQSYVIALVVITLLMIILIGRLRLGLVSMIPNLAPILTVLGLMGWLNIRLDMFTMLIASIAIGLAVDDTVHFMYNFQGYYRKTADVAAAVRHTLHTAGRAMLTTSVVLCLGFFIFTFSTMNNLFYFGVLTGTAILLALAADLLLAPALMQLVMARLQPVENQTERRHDEN